MSSISDIQLPIQRVLAVHRSKMKKGHTRSINDTRYSDALIYVIDGETLYSYHDYKITARTGDVIFLGRGSHYTMDVLSDSYEVIYVDFDFSNNEQYSYRCEKFQNINNKIYMEYFQSLLNIWLTKNKFYETQLISSVTNILYELYISKEKIYASSNDHKLIKKAMEYIHENFTKKEITLEVLAEISKVSQVHFRRTFKKIYNTSPLKYINTLKIEYAKELLGLNNMTVTEIAESCGYSDIFYFCKIFKLTTGQTPSEYRKSVPSKLL